MEVTFWAEGMQVQETLKTIMPGGWWRSKERRLVKQEVVGRAQRGLVMEDLLATLRILVTIEWAKENL